MNFAVIAIRIVQALAADDVLFLADDEQQAETIAAAVTALRPGGVVQVPSSDALPGDLAPASPANAGRRLAALRELRLAQQQRERPCLACVLSGEAAARRYPLPGHDAGAPLVLRVGDLLDAHELATTLMQRGYLADDRVDEPGEMAVRGEVIDVFAADGDAPARIELADAKILAIRSFDPISQRSVAELDTLAIGPAAEPDIAEAGAILEHLEPGVLAATAAAQRHRLRFIQLAGDAAAAGARPLDAIADDQWTAALKDWREVDLDGAFGPVPRFAEKRAALTAFVRFVRPLIAEGRRLVLAGSARDIRFLKRKIAERLALDVVDVADWAAILALPPGAAGCLAMPVDAGFVDDHIVVVAAADLMGSRAQLGTTAAAGSAQPWAGGGAEIRIGDVIVHEDHGVGRVLGLEAAVLESAGEMVALEYAAGARRLVAIDDTDRIWRYGADADAVALDKLDGSSWRRRRGPIDAAIAESAKALTELATARGALSAPILAPDAAAYERFAGAFAFAETADQARAIAAVRDDLASGKPMDRLVIGDVGYGKTEVALRAAALTALAGHQVVIAAPTTVLVRQHIENFRRRFAASGIVVAGLSRLSSAAEKKAVKAGLANGTVHIVIGTGAVMATGVRYARLGLVVVDEEQRFGAADKARLRGAGDVHLLTLSATPIPRSLQMALIGLQQLSIIATPPARRQPIRTSVGVFDDARVRTALLREKSRGGQSFVVVPRIEDLAALAEKLRRIAPDLALVTAHGKMAAAQIDEIMVGFGDRRGDVLLATNIIEAGLDVPRANTMIVWRADRFGLAQLHQLRGRVGRGHRRGQVLLTTAADTAIGERTLKRLRTLASFDRLGAGFDISAQDLDMRGAGDLLGENQAGHMKLIGIDLYQHLLGSALRQARGETVERWTPELHLGATGCLPDNWIPEADVRLALYARLSRLADGAALDGFEEELLDRFGPLPPAAETLLARARIRMAARALRLERIDAGAAAIALTPRRDFAADVEGTGLVEKNGRLLLPESTQEAERVQRVQMLLEQL